MLLDSWRLAPKQIGLDISRKGLKDEEIIPLLRQLHDPTFFTRDVGFYDRKLRQREWDWSFGFRIAALHTGAHGRKLKFTLHGHGDDELAGPACSQVEGLTGSCRRVSSCW